MALDCLLLLLLASAVAAMEGNVPSAEQVGGSGCIPGACLVASRRPHPKTRGQGCSGASATTKRGTGAAPPGAPPAGSRRPQLAHGVPWLPRPGGPWQPAFPQPGLGERGARCIAVQAPSVRAELGFGEEGAPRAIRPLECGRLSAPFLSRARMRLGGRAPPLLFLSLGSAGSGTLDSAG